jgi:hypothetical protein
MLKNVQSFLADGGTIIMQTLKADDDLHNLGWDTDNVRQLISSLHDCCYLNSQWCMTGNRWLECDSYVIRFDESNGVEDIKCAEFYIKFGFANNVAICGVVSCHHSR